MSTLSAYVHRARQFARTLVGMQLALTIPIALLMVITGLVCPQLYTPLTRRALTVLAQNLLHVTHMTGMAYAIVSAVVFLPYTGAMLSVLITAAFLSSIAYRERVVGIHEVLLSYGLSPRTIVLGLTVLGLSLFLLSYVPVSVVITSLAITVLHVAGMERLFVMYLELTILTSLSAVASIMICLALSLLAPVLGRVLVGLLPFQNLAAMVSLLPLLGTFIVVNVYPGLGVLRITLLGTVSAIVVSVALLVLLLLKIRETHLLSSEV